jgi:hypothetical protein
MREQLWKRGALSAPQLCTQLVVVLSGPTHLDQHLLHAPEGLVDVSQEADHGLWEAEV